MLIYFKNIFDKHALILGKFVEISRVVYFDVVFEEFCLSVNETHFIENQTCEHLRTFYLTSFVIFKVLQMYLMVMRTLDCYIFNRICFDESFPS